MGKYDSIIHLERPADLDRAPMSLHNRAAQFAPFDALTGFGGRIYESSRITAARIELSDDVKLEIGRRLQVISERIKERPEVTITFFVPDKTKDGGAYITEAHHIHKVDEYEERMQLEAGKSLAFDDILNIEGELFTL